jgi:hypothetical protein
VLAVVGFVASAGYVMYRRAPRPAFWFFFGAQALAFGSLLLTAKSQTHFPSFEGMNLTAPILIGRHYIFSTTLLMLALFCGAVWLYKHKWIRWYAIAMAVLFVVGLATARKTQQGNLAPPEYGCYGVWAGGHSQWSYYRHLFAESDYVVPINPYPWTMVKGNKPLAWSNTGSSLVSELELGRIGADWRIRAISLAPAFPPAESLTNLVLISLDDQGRELVKSVQLGPKGKQFLYYYFPVRQTASRLAFKTLDGQPLPIAAQFIIYGTGTGVVASNDFVRFGIAPDSPARRWLP